MSQTPSTLKNKLGAALCGLALVFSGTYYALQIHSPAHGEVRELTPREAFKSGGERSEVVLHEVLETLKRIDARLERFENAMRAAAKQQEQK